MLVERIYLKDAKYTKKNIVYLMSLKIFNGNEVNIYQSKKGIVIICNFETNQRGINSIYKTIKENTGSSFVYGKYSENEPYKEKSKTNIIKPIEEKPKTVFDHPSTIWYIKEIPHKKCSRCKQWQPVSNFYKDSNSKYGIKSCCKICNRNDNIKNYQRLKLKKSIQFNKPFVYNPDN